MARAKRKLPAKPAAFFSPHHRGHFCPVIRYPNTKPPPPTIHTPQKPHGSVKRHRPIPEHKKNPLPLRTPPAGFVFSHHRSPSCCRHPIHEHKAPAADNTHPTKTSRLGQTAPTDARTQKTRCRSEHRRPLSFLRSTAVTSAAVNRLPSAKNSAAAPNTTGRFHFSAPPRSLLPPSSDTRTQSPRRRRQYTPHKNPRPGQTAPTDARTQKTRCRQYTPHKNLTARSNGTDRYPNTKKPAAAPNTAGRFRFL